VLTDVVVTILASLVFVALLLSSYLATPIASAAFPDGDPFEFRVDKWMSLHHTA
jgi:hypothetical protein